MTHLTRSTASFLALALLLIASTAQAAILVPTGLNPGDKYHLAFVTSTTRDATSSDIADYNFFVQGVANAAGIGSGEGVDWFAIGSTATVDARDNAVVGSDTTPVYLMDGTTKIADGFTDLWDLSIESRFGTDESGASLPVDRIWTGTNGFGVEASQGALGAPKPMVGSTGSTVHLWVRDLHTWDTVTLA